VKEDHTNSVNYLIYYFYSLRKNVAEAILDNCRDS
jgi:hypothetical protein